MRGLFRAEAIKTFRRKLVWVLAGIMGVLMAMLGSVFYLLPRFSPDEAVGLPIIARPEAFAIGAQQAVGQTWLPIVIVVVLFGSETAGPVWRSALTLDSRRWLHLIVKLLIGTLAATLVVLAGVVVWSIFTVALAVGTGAPDFTTWVGLVAKVLLTMLAWTGIGLAAAGWLRSLGPALGAGIGFSLFEGVFGLWERWSEISIGLASQRIFGRFLESSGMGVGVVGDMGMGQAYAVVTGWAVISLMAAIVSVYVRDP